MKQYVLGFMFDAPGTRVVLVRKRRPAWQAGKLNGVGGKIEPGEQAAQAMARECLEETGVRTQPQQWQEYARMHGTSFNVVCFRTALDSLDQVRSATDEEVLVVPVDYSRILAESISNLGWLIAAALDPEPQYIEARYAY